MSQETGDDATLLRTIAELRSDVNRLIDEQLAQVRALEEKRTAEVAVERRFSPLQPPDPTPPAARPSRASVRAREATELPPPPPPRAEAASDDPSQRLDALARHLDGRLRRSGAKKGAEGETRDRTTNEGSR